MRLTALDNTCALLAGSAASGDEYWSYEWCHRKEIRQFHFGLPAQPGGEVRVCARLGGFVCWWLAFVGVSIESGMTRVWWGVRV